MIQIQLLGEFRAVGDDGSRFRSLGRKSECLICLLALSDGLEVTRERAAGLIWSERAVLSTIPVVRSITVTVRPELPRS